MNEEEQMSVPPSGSGCQPSASAADASSQSGIPNAYALAKLLRALAHDCDNTDGWQGASPDLRASADLLENLAVTVRHVYAERLPDTWFVCGASTVADHNGLPDRIHVCPAYGCDWSVIYSREDGGDRG